MRIELDPSRLRILPAGEERLKRGHSPDLPLRWLEVARGDERFNVAVGPVDHGGPDEELWEFVLSVG